MNPRPEQAPRAKPRKGPGGTRPGAGRPAEAGVAREESLRVLVTPAEKAALVAAAGGPGRLSAMLRHAPEEAARWREVAAGLAEALASGERAEEALGAYCKLAESHG